MTIANCLKTANNYSVSDNILHIIIQYLLEKKDHKDDLDGITLFVYHKELENLSKEILGGIAELISRKILIIIENSSGQKFYQLSDNESLLSDFLLNVNYNK